MRRPHMLPVYLLLIAAATVPGLALSQGNGFRWFWRGSSGGSTTRKFTLNTRGGSSSGRHSMVVVRVKDHTGRTVTLDPADSHITRRVVQGIYGKGTNKPSYTFAKTIGGISSNGEPLPLKPPKFMQPPPLAKMTKAKTMSSTSHVADNLVPSRWYRPPRVETSPKHSTFMSPASVSTSKSTFQPQRSAKLLRTRPNSKLSARYLPPAAPVNNGIITGTTAGPIRKPFVITPPKELSGPSLPAPTPTPASHVANDIRRNLSGRVDGSVFFGILPVVNDLQRMPPAKMEPPPKIVISRRPGKCPFINMTRCPAPSLIPRGRCSNDNQCPTDQRCCYNPCAASSQCMTAVL